MLLAKEKGVEKTTCIFHLKSSNKNCVYTSIPTRVASNGKKEKDNTRVGFKMKNVCRTSPSKRRRREREVEEKLHMPSAAT